MNKTATAQQTQSTDHFPHAQGMLQRKCVCGSHTPVGGECSTCAAMKKIGLQRKLKIGASNDSLEHEADRVADQVMAMPLNSCINATPPRIQRFSGQASDGLTTAPASVDRVLAGSGRPLEPALRQDMESRFGYDFSQVRVHTGGAAEQSARDVNAQAYTVGSNVVFGERRFAPERPESLRILAHELTHVIQQENKKESSSYVHGVSPMIQRQSLSSPPSLSSTSPSFSITDIPIIMDALGWNPAAALMRDWFSRSANEVPASGKPNTTAITVSWANGFSRSLSVFNDIIADRIWMNAASQDLIKQRLIRVGLPSPGGSVSFGLVSGSFPALHANHINHRRVGQGLLDPLDGLAGALANFDFYVVIQGSVDDIGPSPWHAFFTDRSYQVNISNVGIYIRDSYDFNGPQRLGCWDPVANSVYRTSILNPNATCVTNETFRDWRTSHSRGGDFYVYSDIETRTVTDSFNFNV